MEVGKLVFTADPGGLPEKVICEIKGVNRQFREKIKLCQNHQ